MSEGPLLVGGLLVLLVATYMAWYLVKYCMDCFCMLANSLLVIAILISVIDCFTGQTLSKYAFENLANATRVAANVWTLLQNMVPALLKTYKGINA